MSLFEISVVLDLKILLMIFRSMLHKFCTRVVFFGVSKLTRASNGLTR